MPRVLKYLYLSTIVFQKIPNILLPLIQSYEIKNKMMKQI